ncbi:MAG: hypothetical protein A2035_02740 [Nitrospirae bacterium GWA2_42_11]|nr:MAG: hypothetical protein A2035_02740 [Nitrospirae bacterium GWA2_42_11]
MKYLSIVIVTFNAIKHINDCLESIYKTAPLPLIEIIVSDNNSTDGTVEFIKHKYPAVKLVENRCNLGFGPANNRGANRSSGRYILFLNDDTIVCDNALAKMISFMDDNNNIGAMGPKLLNPDYSLQPSMSRYPSIWRNIVYALLPKTYLLNNEKVRNLLSKFSPQENLGRYGSHNKVCDTDFPKGACLLVRRSVIEQVGLFDENIFFFSEEAELCYRIKKAGWRVVFYPHAEIIHIGGSTSGREVDKVPGRRFIQKHKSNLYFFEKHGSRMDVMAYKAGIVAALVVRLVFLYLLSIFSRSKTRREVLATNEVYLNTIRMLIDARFRGKNVFTELKLKHTG